MSFVLRPGEQVLLLGPSGAGKSTLALTCAGLIPRAVPARVEGSIELDGLDLVRMRVQEAATRIAMVLQDPDVQVVRETVFDEVCFALENLRLPVLEVERRAEDALARLGLRDRAGDDPDRLSGGERQRLAIACALAQRPQLIVLDEPAAQLDPPGRREVYRALRDLASTTRCGLLLVGHDPEPVLSQVNRLLVLDRTGRLALDGAPDLVTGSRRAQLFSLGALVPARSPRTPVRPRDGESLVEVRGVTVERLLGRGARTTTVLRELDLTLAPGSVTAILGANGSGKTSLLRTLAGTLPAARGTVRVAGQDPRRLEPARLRRLVGFAFQNPSRQFVRDVVDEDLAQALGTGGPAHPEVAHVLEDFGLADRCDANPLTLSFGQQRRLSVAAAMGPEPSLLLLDEPLAGLDQTAADRLLDRLRAHAARGGAVVIATHDLAAAGRWATGAVVLAGGRVLDSGPAVRLLADHHLLRRAGLEPGAPLPAPSAAPAVPRDGFLAGLNPLAKVAVALPVMLALFFTTNPLVFVAEGLLGVVAALAGSRRARHDLPRALPVALVLGAVMTAALAVWVRPDAVAGTPVLAAIGPWRLRLGALGEGGITVGRIAALLAVGTTFALTTEAAALTRALMGQARLPYRVGYTVLATYRFVPRLLVELDTIRAARRLRGVAPGRGPLPALRRWLGYPFPLLVASIRHAEQVAVSMDARAFGAFADRTERTVSVWRVRDTAYVLGGLVAAALVWAAVAVPVR